MIDQPLFRYKSTQGSRACREFRELFRPGRRGCSAVELLALRRISVGGRGHPGALGRDAERGADSGAGEPIPFNGGVQGGLLMNV